MKKIIYLIGTISLFLILVGCTKNVENAHLSFDEPAFYADSEGKVEITGTLKNGENGILDGNINTKNIKVKVNPKGKFKIYYTIQNIHDDKIYLGLKSNGTIVGGEADIIISPKTRDDYLVSANDIINQYREDGNMVLNPSEISGNDMANVGLSMNKISPMTSMQFEVKTISDCDAKVRIFTFNSYEELNNAYLYLIQNTRSLINFDGVNLNIPDTHDLIPPVINDIKTNNNPQLSEKYSYYINNVNKEPLLFSWVYEAWIEDSGYVLIQQDPEISKTMAGEYESGINLLLNRNKINESEVE